MAIDDNFNRKGEQIRARPKPPTDADLKLAEARRKIDDILENQRLKDELDIFD